MHIESLKVFCDLVDTSSFSEAANINKITQSAVSQQIRALEKKHNVVFFERGNKNFAVTAEGQIFHQAALRILEEYSAIEIGLNALKGEVSGDLKISTILSIGFHDLPGIIESFKQEFSQVNLQTQYLAPCEVYETIHKRQSDVGIVAFPAKEEGLISEVIAEQPYVAVLRPDNPLAQLGETSLNQLSSEKLIQFSPDSRSSKEFDRLVRYSGSRLEYESSFDTLETVKRAIEVTNGIALLPASTVATDVADGRLATLKIQESGIVRPIGVIRRQSGVTSGALSSFLEHLRKNLPTPS